ncbi:hypothetical protein Z945_2964 [Sulfitobacter noctilucae]|uniref:hypothetical protein n=1 Tax=Sulfitobacter noctilucae TaxID=1342302 RepID=UPI0004681BB7|nr:hypothetical protein [Sulfitobacter noctilucae]KIN75065.1 hypothetical protein Z945_2964 [Sulfitobacter noctilucae]
MTDTIIVQIRPRRAMAIGVCTGLVAAIWLMICFWLFVFHANGLTWAGFLSTLVGAVFAGLACLNIGIAFKKPAALRMDAHGISGFYADPATWHEIEKIDTITDAKGRRFLGFGLLDAVAFRDHQTPWRRFVCWANGRHSGLHIIISEALLRDATAEGLAAQAKRLHQQAATR